MTTYRLMDGASGRPGNGPGSVSSYSGSFQAGMIFYLTSGGMWFEGYWWWVPTGGDTGAQKFALWNLKSNSGADGSLISAATVTSGTLTAGAWNYIPLSTPIPLSIGQGATAGGLFCATTAWTAVHGFPDTNNQFGTGNTYANGITNGPLATFGQSSAVPNYTCGSTFGTSHNDPTAGAPIATDSTHDNFWLDLQVSDTAPSGYSGTYQLYPNRYDTNSDTSQDATTNFVLATEFHLSQPCKVHNIWYYSPSGTSQLATRASVYSITGADSGTELVAVTSPSWSGAAGSGWVYAAVSGTPTLAAGEYKVAVYNGAGSPDLWSVKDNLSGYWLTGEGGGGITNGPLSAPAVAGASTAYIFDGSGAGNTPPFSNGSGGTEAGQSTFAQTGPQYPYLYVDAQGQNYWLDIEVTPAGTAHTATAALTVTPSFSAARTRGKYRTGALTVTPSFSAARTRGKYRTGSLTVTPSFSAARLHGHGRTASLIVVPAFSAARTAGHVRTASLLVTPTFRALWTGGAAPVVQQGSWWGLVSVLKESREEFQAYVSRPPMACPVCGEPLVNAPATASGSGVELYCKYAGDHEFHYPRDWVAPSRPWY